MGGGFRDMTPLVSSFWFWSKKSVSKARKFTEPKILQFENWTPLTSDGSPNQIETTYQLTVGMQELTPHKVKARPWSIKGSTWPIIRSYHFLTFCRLGIYIIYNLHFKLVECVMRFSSKYQSICQTLGY